MKKRATVTEIMTQNFKSISLHNGTILQAKEMMEQNGFRHLPVTNGDDLAGIISLTDIKRISFGANYDQESSVDKAIFDTLTLSQVMVHNPITISTKTTIKEAAEIISSNEFNALPVVEGDGAELKGIVTSTDLIKYLLDQY